MKRSFTLLGMAFGLCQMIVFLNIQPLSVMAIANRDGISASDFAFPFPLISLGFCRKRKLSLLGPLEPAPFPLPKYVSPTTTQQVPSLRSTRQTSSNTWQSVSMYCWGVGSSPICPAAS